MLVEKLYKATNLCKSIGVKYNLVFDYHYDLQTPRQIMLYWINQRYDQKRRYYHQIALKAARDRAIYEGLSIILATDKDTDDAIRIIRSSEKDSETIPKLRKRFNLTEFQAGVILDYKLRTLQKMDIKEIYRKRDDAIAEYKKYRKLLSSDNAIKEAIRQDLLEGKKKYGRSRNAKLRNIKASLLGDPDEKKYVVYNNDFYYCFTDPADLEKIVPKIDNRYRMVEIRNTDNVLVFDKSGIMKVLNGYAFNINATGITMATLGVSNVASIIADNPEANYDQVAMITEQGYGKVMELSEVMKSTKTRVITLNSEDHLIAVLPMNRGYHPDSIIGMVQDDKMYYVKLVDFPVYKRSSSGNRMVKVKNLALTNAIYLDATDNPDYMLLYGESGYVKLLDTAYLSFSKKGNNAISLQGKRINGAILLRGSEDTAKLFMNRKGSAEMDIKMQIGKMVRFQITTTGEEQKFKMSTSIGSPTKILRVLKNEWYAFCN